MVFTVVIALLVRFFSLLRVSIHGMGWEARDYVDTIAKTSDGVIIQSN